MASLFTARNFATVARGITHRLLDLLYPPECPSCRAAVDTMHNFCPGCYEKLRLISAPMCLCCGTPFAVAVEADSLCPSCLEAKPPYHRARAVMVYDAISAPLIAAFKFHDQWAGLERYATMMHAAGATLLAEADMLAPIPLHWRRLWQRRYNQSALLAHAIAARAQKPCLDALLKRTRYTQPQMKLHRKERLKNVQRAFAVRPRYDAAIQGKHIVLIDDVITTGATAESCTKALLKAGAAHVSLLTLARTVRE